MARKSFGMAVLAAVLLAGMGTVHAQQVNIDQAIQNASNELSGRIQRGTRVAVLSMEAGSVRMSDYLIDEMIVAFVRAGGFTVVDRAQLDLIAQELHFQMSYEVDDATAQSIGRIMGVQSIVTGAFEPLGEFYRFRVRLIEVETAAIRGIYTVNVQNDSIVASLLGGASRAVPGAGVAAIPGVPAAHTGFNAGQRLGTWGLNSLVPGLGSFVIMNDTFGGVFQIVCVGLGFIMLIVGVIGEDVWEPDPWGGQYVWEPNYGAMTGGLALLATSFVFNIVRSATFSPRAPRTASIVNPDSWNIAIIPGRNGSKVSLSHTLRF